MNCWNDHPLVQHVPFKLMWLTPGAGSCPGFRPLSLWASPPKGGLHSLVIDMQWHHRLCITFVNILGHVTRMLRLVSLCWSQGYPGALAEHVAIPVRWCHDPRQLQGRDGGRCGWLVVTIDLSPIAVVSMHPNISLGESIHFRRQTGGLHIRGKGSCCSFCWGYNCNGKTSSNTQEE